MKITITIIIFLLSLRGYCIERNWKMDLDKDGKNDKIEIYTKQDSFHLRINMLDYNLNSNSLYAIVDENNQDHIILFVDVDQDSTLEIAVCTEHQLFSNKSVLRILKFQNNSIIPLKFYYNLENYYSELISLDKINLLSTTNKGIYVVAGMKGYNGINGETFFYYQVDLYRWENDLKKLIKFGEKYYPKIDRQNLKSIVF